ncbi:MAG: hypothetical protein RSD36_17480 [Terrisporobacter sp.]
MKTKSITPSKYFELVNPKYVFFRLTPHSSCRNNSSDKLAQLVNKIYLDFSKRIYKEERKLFFKANAKVSYYIYIEKFKAEFYFIIPAPYKRLFKEKISDTWRNIEVKEVDILPQFSKDCTKYSLDYKKEDALSLAVDKKNNDLLSSTLNIIEILESENDEKIGIIYNFIPSSPTVLSSFKEYHKEIIEKYNKNKPLDKNKKNGWYILKLAFNFLVNTIDGLIDKIQDDLKQPIQNNITFISNRELTRTTHKKETSVLCRSQIVVLSESTDKNNQEINGRSACESFSIIDEDNRLIPNEIKKDFDILDYNYPCSILDTSTQECSNFIQMPGRELLQHYKVIEHAKILENPVPKCLRDGNMFIGLVNYKEQVYKAFFSTHKEFQNLERVLIGSKGSGKSYKMMKIAKNAIELGRGVVLIDIIEDCKLSQSIAYITPEDRLLRIRCNNVDEIQAFIYNEIPINESMTPYEIFTNAVKRTQQLQVLLDSINNDSTQLSSRMIKYLFASGAIVYSAKPNASLSDVLDCLEFHETRHEFINLLSPELSELLNKRIKKLSELDDTDKNGKVKGTKDSKIEGILDRTAILDSMSSHTELALNKPANNNINFVDAIRDNKIILIEIPEQEFPSQMLRNIMATFYLSKVWLAKQLLAPEKHQPTTELLFDEFYKCPNAQLLFETVFAEARKYRLISTVAIHSLGQLSPKCRMTLKSGGASYLLLAGADIQAYRELHVQFEKFGYDEQSFLNLETYNALCLIKNEDENYSSFIAYLPA